MNCEWPRSTTNNQFSQLEKNFEKAATLYFKPLNSRALEGLSRMIKILGPCQNTFTDILIVNSLSISLANQTFGKKGVGLVNKLWYHWNAINCYSMCPLSTCLANTQKALA